MEKLAVLFLSFSQQVPPLQGKLQYMRVLNDLPPFGGILFQTVGLVIRFECIKYVVKYIFSAFI